MIKEATVAALALSAVASGYKLAQRDGAAAHGSHDHGSHESAAASVNSGYASPVATGYEEPSDSYGSVAATGYGAEPALPDLTPIIIAILVLTGLSLLFPTFVTLSNVRKKRSIDQDEVSPMNDVIERVNDIYMSVIESEECMERIACEIGGLANDFGLKDNAVTRMADPFVPSKYKSFYKQFVAGKNCKKMKCGSY